jgi:hypothetical protein
MSLNWTLTPLMWALVEAAERLGGGGRETELAREAAAHGESGHYGDDAHFAKGIRELEARGIFRGEIQGTARLWWMTDQAWLDRDHDGPAPGTQQLGLLG